MDIVDQLMKVSRGILELYKRFDKLTNEEKFTFMLLLGVEKNLCEQVISMNEEDMEEIFGVLKEILCNYEMESDILYAAATGGEDQIIALRVLNKLGDCEDKTTVEEAGKAYNVLVDFLEKGHAFKVDNGTMELIYGFFVNHLADNISLTFYNNVACYLNSKQTDREMLTNLLFLNKVSEQELIKHGFELTSMPINYFIYDTSCLPDIGDKVIETYRDKLYEYLMMAKTNYVDFDLPEEDKKRYQLLMACYGSGIKREKNDEYRSTLAEDLYNEKNNLEVFKELYKPTEDSSEILDYVFKID